MPKRTGYRLVEVGGTRWPPTDERADAVEWKLRHAPEQLTASDRMVAASILAAYRELLFKPAAKQRAVLLALRQRREEK